MDDLERRVGDIERARLRIPHDAIGDGDIADHLPGRQVRLDAPQGAARRGDWQIFARRAPRLFIIVPIQKRPRASGAPSLLRLSGWSASGAVLRVSLPVLGSKKLMPPCDATRSVAVGALGHRGDHFGHRPDVVPACRRNKAVQNRGHRHIEPVDRLLFGTPERAFADLVASNRRRSARRASQPDSFP